MHQGMRKSPEDIATIKAILNNDTLVLSVLDTKPAHLGSTRLERLMLALWQFPKHCLMTHLTCIIPILVGCLPLALGVLHAEVMIDSFPNISAVSLPVTCRAISPGLTHSLLRLRRRTTISRR